MEFGLFQTSMTSLLCEVVGAIKSSHCSNVSLLHASPRITTNRPDRQPFGVCRKLFARPKTQQQHVTCHQEKGY